MAEKYSESTADTSGASAGRVLAIDSGSPVSSLALQWNGRRSQRNFAVGESSSRLIDDVDGMLAELGGSLEDLDSLIVARGPGSFTGLRVGLATALGLHQALAVSATAVSTLEALARQARRRAPTSSLETIVAAVDALRGEHFAQPFAAASGKALGQPDLQPTASLLAETDALVIGFGLEPEPPHRFAAEPLAIDLLDLAGEASTTWDATLLTEPLYLRPPAARPAPSR